MRKGMGHTAIMNQNMITASEWSVKYYEESVGP